jgi:hypothetical protein
MGHTDASLALEVYSEVMERKRDTGERMDALIRRADWAATGSNEADEIPDDVYRGNKKAPERGFL